MTSPEEPALYVITYTVRASRWLPSFVKVRETWEKVCTYEEATQMRDELRADGVTDAELRSG